MNFKHSLTTKELNNISSQNNPVIGEGYHKRVYKFDENIAVAKEKREINPMYLKLGFYLSKIAYTAFPDYFPDRNQIIFGKDVNKQESVRGQFTVMSRLVKVPNTLKTYEKFNLQKDKIIQDLTDIGFAPQCFDTLPENFMWYLSKDNKKKLAYVDNLEPVIGLLTKENFIPKRDKLNQIIDPSVINSTTFLKYIKKVKKTDKDKAEKLEMYYKGYLRTLESLEI